MCKVSVIVPTYNAQAYLSKCMDTLVNQTFTDYEIIVINDGSIDNTQSILESYQETNGNIKVINQSNQGQAVARNKGIESANGEFVCFVDSDDYVSLEYLEKLMTNQMKHEADIVWCDAFAIRNGETFRINDNLMVADTDKKTYLLNNSGPWRKLVRTSMIIDNHLYFPKLDSYEDVAVVPLYGVYAQVISYVNEPLYYYIMHEGSLMHQVQYNEKMLSIFGAMHTMEHSFIEANCDREFYEEIEFLLIEHLLHAASLRFFMFKEGEHEINRISAIMKNKFPKWKDNKYFKKKDWKYRFICQLFYHQQFRVLKMILK